jgi:GntR family transcriptional regulator / MocR family aminotransferase
MDLRDLKPLGDRRAPIYFQLYRRFRDAIATGKLAPGDRVPSVRSLASELNLARGTVEAAYQMLTGGGHLWARGPAGTVVSPQLDVRKGSTGPVESIGLRRRPQSQVNGSNSVGNVRLHSKGRAAQNMVRGSNKSAS